MRMGIVRCKGPGKCPIHTAYHVGYRDKDGDPLVQAWHYIGGDVVYGTAYVYITSDAVSVHVAGCFEDEIPNDLYVRHVSFPCRLCGEEAYIPSREVREMLVTNVGQRYSDVEGTVYSNTCNDCAEDLALVEVLNGL